MVSVDERNDRVTEILNSFFKQATNEELEIDETLYSENLDNLFATTVWGFRETLLVAIVGMKLDDCFKASSHFYDCKPRALYGKPIKNFLIEHNIPHRQDGPLNVAKAAEGLNDAWAAQRQPKAVAESVVAIINLLENGNAELIDNIGISLLRRLLAETTRVEQYDIEIEPSTDPEWLYYISSELVEKVPDAGNTPQKIAGLMLRVHHLYMNTKIKVTGVDDRASVTSTTSKKPGDINEESFETGEIFKVYEITVKPFDLARIRDSHTCIKTYNEENQTNIQEVIVICRPEDCPKDIQSSNMNLCLGSYIYQDVIYYYWDIYEWMCFMLQRMTNSARKAYYELLNSYISDINTSETVKQFWQTLHDNNN